MENLKLKTKKDPFFSHTGHSMWQWTHHEYFHYIAQLIVNGDQDNKREEGNDVYEASDQRGNVSVVKEDTDEIAHADDWEAIVRKVQEQNEPVGFGKNIAKLEDNDEDGNCDQQKPNTLDQPGKEMTAGVHTHHLHVL